MKKLIYILFGCFLLVVQQACYDDDSTLPDKAIIEVDIQTSARDSINLYFNDTLRIPVNIESSTDELTYEWGYGKSATNAQTGKSSTVFKKISTEKSLEYIPRELGHYELRQLVTSKDGSTIKYYHIFVNSPFEEGFLILGRKSNNKGSIAFLKTLTPEDIEMGLKEEFRQNVYSYANQGDELYLDPVDCDKVGDYIYVLHGESQKLVQLDAKTMVKVFEYDFKYYQNDFIPTRMMSHDGRFCREFYIPSKNGGVAMVQTREQFIFPYVDLPKGYSWVDGNDRPSYFSSCNRVYIGRRNSDKNNVVCWSGANADREIAMRPCYDYFEDREVIAMFQNEKTDGNDVFVFNKYNGRILITAINSMMYNFSEGKAPWIMFERPLSNSEIIDENTQLLTNDYYKCVFITHKNKVYRWYYNQPDADLPSDHYIKLGDDEEIKAISHFQKSRNDSDYQDYSVQTEIYIATYNPKRPGQYKGSLYVYDADSGKEIKKYEGISDEPIDVFYKIK